MVRRDYLRASALLGIGALTSRIPIAAGQETIDNSSAPLRIVMGGYGPATTGFSLALKRIGDRLTAQFGSAIDVRYVYNILDLGYRADDILWLVEQGVLTLGYQSSSYLGERVPAVGVADLPYLFTDTESARAAMDGPFGRALTTRIEAGMGYRILGYFENGFRHISNRLRPIRTPDDLRGMTIRVLPSDVHVRTFELLGALPIVMDLSEALQRIEAGTVDAQENPLANTVTYGVDRFHRFHSITNHFYVSRPIFVHRPSFDAWPPELQMAMRAAAADAVAFQREQHIREELEAADAIRGSGGQILELAPAEIARFRNAVTPLYSEVGQRFDADLLALVGR